MYDPDKRFSLIWTIAGGYLLYLGDQLLTLWYHGETDYPIVAISAGILFVVSGGLLLFMAWKKWHSQDKISQKEQKELDNNV